MPKESSLAASLNKLAEMSSSGEVAKVKQRRQVKEQAWVSNDSAKNLLGSLLSDSSKAAEEELARQEAAAAQAVEAARRAREREEEMLQLEAKRELLSEMQAQEEMRLRQLEMQAQLQRQKDIEAGVIDLEEEARLQREAEERQRKEAEERQRKEEEKRASEALLREQAKELEALRQKELLEQAMPKRSKLIPIVLAAVVLFGAAGVGIFLHLNQEEIDIYAPSAQYDTRTIGFMPDESAMLAVQMQLVKQAEPPKPVVARPRSASRSRPKTGGSTVAAPEKKPSGLKSGGLLGAKKGL